MAGISEIKLPNNNSYKLRDDYHTWGGRNLIWNSNFRHGSAAKWNNWGSPTTREIVNINNKYWMHIISTALEDQGYSQFISNRNGTYNEFRVLEPVICSFLAYGKNGGEKINIECHGVKNNTTVLKGYTQTLTTTPTKYVLEPHLFLGLGTEMAGLNFYIGNGAAAVQEFWITNIKVENGNKPTDWSPAPEDYAQVNGTQLVLIG